MHNTLSLLPQILIGMQTHKVQSTSGEEPGIQRTNMLRQLPHLIGVLLQQLSLTRTNPRSSRVSTRTAAALGSIRLITSVAAAASALISSIRACNSPAIQNVSRPGMLLSGPLIRKLIGPIVQDGGDPSLVPPPEVIDGLDGPAVFLSDSFRALLVKSRLAKEDVLFPSHDVLRAFRSTHR